MPLKIVRRNGRALLYVRGTVRGQSIFECTGTGDPALAAAYRAKREAELFEFSVYGARAIVTFATAVESYLRAEPRKPGTVAAVGKLLKLFGGRPLAQIDAAVLNDAYAALLRPDAPPATKLRQVLTPLRAILEHAAGNGWCARPIFKVPKQPAHRIAFLTPAQATDLVQAAAPHLRPLLVFLIGTAARMSEALELTWADVDLEGARVTFGRTKGGQWRWVDLAPAVRASLAALPHRDGRVFRPVYAVRKGRDQAGQQWRVGEGFRDSGRNGGGQAKTAWAAACRRAGLPGEWKEWEGKGGKRYRRFAATLRLHDLRHTAASWHYAVHRDLLALQRFGGWKTINQVQVYTHLLPPAYAQQAAEWLGLATAVRAIGNEAS